MEVKPLVSRCAVPPLGPLASTVSRGGVIAVLMTSLLACGYSPWGGRVAVEPTEQEAPAIEVGTVASVEVTRSTVAGHRVIPGQGWAMHPQSSVSAPDYPASLVSPDNCADIVDGGPMQSDGCVTADLRCGDIVIGHTVGGTERFDSKFYEAKKCWPSTINHNSGGERVYRLQVPAGEWRAWVTMYSPCGDLNLAGMRSDSPVCPTLDTNIDMCEMSVKPSRVTDRIELTSQTTTTKPTWYVVVEGRDKAESPFSLHVQCAPGLGGPFPADQLINADPSKPGTP